MKIKIIILLFLSILVLPAMAQAETLDELIQRIASANNQELSKLSFFELNILKNTIYSSKGFKYADDRSWLYEYFYNDKSKTRQSITKSQWDLSQYDFPKPPSEIDYPKSVSPVVFKIDSPMEKAITNVRVALFKKIQSLQDIKKIELNVEIDYMRHFQSGDHLIFGRRLDANTKLFKESILREVHGYYCVYNIMKDPSKFDASELLGVYIGSVVLLRNIIEAQQGKIFEGNMGWEISQLVGVTPQNFQYDESKLTPEIKEKLKLLDVVIKKMMQSDIGDVPEQLKVKGLDINTVEVYYDEGC